MQPALVQAPFPWSVMPAFAEKAMDSRDIGLLLKEQRKRLGLSADQIISETGIPNPSYLSALEAGTYNARNSKYFPALARVLRLAPEIIKEINPDLFVEISNTPALPQVLTLASLADALEFFGLELLFAPSKFDYYAEDGGAEHSGFLATLKAMRLVSRYVKDANHYVYVSKAKKIALISQTDVSKLEAIAYRNITERTANSAPHFIAGRELEFVGSIVAYYTTLDNI